MGYDEYVEMVNRLCRLAAAEREKCGVGLEPECVNGYWRHGHDLCRAAKTHDKISELESELTVLGGVA